MADIYHSSAGSLVKSKVSGSSFLSATGLDKILNGGKFLCTSIRVDRGQEVQFLKTLDNAYYLYCFGEAPGKIMVGGLLFFVDCASPNGNASTIRDINTYYEKNNAYASKQPLTVSMGAASFNCILTNLSVAADMNAFNYGSFSLSFTTIPPRK